MTLTDYVRHYFSMPGLLIFIVMSLVIVCLIHAILIAVSARGAQAKRPNDRTYAMYDAFKLHTERYYELIFSSTSTLFFTGIYFLIDFNYFNMSGRAWEFWQSYHDFLLLGLLVLSIVIINVLDHFLLPIKKLGNAETAALRMAGMIYMLAIFAYIKFIYQDDNYDIMVFYFITMLIGRFVYLDASFDNFKASAKAFVHILPMLALVLLSTALLALYGFGSGYLLTANGVVVNLFIAHCFLIVEITVLSRTGLTKKVSGMVAVKKFGRIKR